MNYLHFSVVGVADSLCDEAVFVDSFSKLYKDIWQTHRCVIVKVHTGIYTNGLHLYSLLLTGPVFQSCG